MALNKNLTLVVVLDDGETYANLNACRLVCLTDTQMEKAAEGAKISMMEQDGETVSTARIADYLFQDPHFDDFIEECNAIAEQMDWTEDTEE